MGGEGTITGMITNLRNNDLLRRKKMLFRKDKSIFDQSTTSAGSLYKPLLIKPLSKEERDYYRKKTLAQNRARFLRTLLCFIAMLSLLGMIARLLLS